MHALKLGSCEANYHLACLYSLSNLCDAALHYLKRAKTAEALPPSEDLQHYHWLENVREEAAFAEFMEGDHDR